MARYDSILGAVGRTPVVRINKLGPEGVNIFVKVESFNPDGVGQGPAGARHHRGRGTSGALKPGQTVIEATSGNTGIGLAMVCAQKGYPLVVTMAENFSVERRKMMRFLGAKVVLTPASEKGTGMLRKAEELAEAHGWFLCRQFENEANADIHSRDDGAGDPRRLQGRAARLLGHGFRHRRDPQGRLARAQEGATGDQGRRLRAGQLAASRFSGIAQARNAGRSHAESHPSFRAHLMQGWTPDFIPKLAEDAQSAELLDVIVPITG